MAKNSYFILIGDKLLFKEWLEEKGVNVGKDYCVEIKRYSVLGKQMHKQMMKQQTTKIK